ncbi:MAG: YceI family protein [Acidimicrobiia bacterium]|nr:YceI family protein [Acidimicrobiia bacterium]
MSVMTRVVITGLLACGLGGVTAAKAEAQVTLELAEGTRARYLVNERLAGVSISSPASGLTEAVTGRIVIKADGSIDAANSKITVDMRTLKSDQALRDLYLQGAVLNTKQFPMLEFVPLRAEGLPNPLPAGTPFEQNRAITIPSAVGFTLIGNMTFHGVTKEVTWSVVATLLPDTAAGTANATVTFATFGLTKPVIPILASADDNIRLEIEFRAKRTAGM